MDLCFPEKDTDLLINLKMPPKSKEEQGAATRGKKGEKVPSKAKDAEAKVDDSKTLENDDKKKPAGRGNGADASQEKQKKDGKGKSTKKNSKAKVSGYRASSPERKKYKITKHIDQPNKRSWQIRGFRIQEGLLGCYFQKSINSGREEQPFLVNFMKKFERDQELREVQLGIIYVGARSDGEGNLIPADPAYEKSQWYLFLAAEQDVGSLEQWLSNVCKRMNDDELAGNEKLFKWNPSFTITSYGDDGDDAKLPKLHQVIMHEQVVDFVIGLFSLKNPLNRGKGLDELNLGGYFETEKAGKDAINAHFME